MKIYTKLSCCFNSFSRNCIEISIITISAIGFLLSIMGMAVIPWGYTSRAMQVFYLLSLILFFYCFLIPCLIKLLRKIKKNEKKMDYCNINAFIIVCICLISILLNICVAIGAIPDLKNKKVIEMIEIKDPNGDVTIINNEEIIATKKQLAFAVLFVIINLILWIILLFLWIAEVIRLKYKIEGSYNDYIMEQKNISANCSEKPVLNQNEDNFKKYKSELNLETKNILRYSYQAKYGSNPIRNKDKENKSVDVIHKLKEEKKEKICEKYLENGELNPYYSNFQNITALNISSVNNSINPVN